MNHLDLEKETNDLRSFFDESPSEVDAMVLRIATLFDRPEWLRGISRADRLPRFQWGTGGGWWRYDFLKKPAQETKRAERIVWIVEQLTGAWFYDNRYVYFDSDYDAVLYRLMWE